MSLVTERIRYSYDGIEFEGHFAYDDAIDGTRPLVTVSHAWSGRSPFENEKAEKLAAMGYAGFAIDAYGAGVRGTTREENSALMTPMLDNRSELLERLRAGVAAGAAHAVADETRIAAIGYCFGGLCALDLARSGDPLAGVASFHGLFHAPDWPVNNIKAKVLALHGYDDPMATPDSVLALAKELSDAGADWQLVAYGNTKHSFTNPLADDPANGIVYDASANARSWLALEHFLTEIF
ncbi:MAG: dienelactone hydrolase family protein [Pseudomonadota bacterium]